MIDSSVAQPMSATVKSAKQKRTRKPTLRAALKAAEKAGRLVKSATIENDRITITFGEPTAAENNIDEWNERLDRRGKH